MHIQPSPSMTSRFSIPTLGFGLGLRSPHYEHILTHWPDVDWFEIISENFMDNEGKAKQTLARIKERYPIAMHGVSLSIGTIDPLNSMYLKQLRTLIDWLNPPWVSDHLCWTGIAHKNTHDLLPVPYTEEALHHIVSRIKQVQDAIGRPLVLENPSTYLEFTDSYIPEQEFLSRMAEEADCGLLLDINNVFVTCFNHRLSPQAYLDALPLDRVVQIHLAGHTNKGTHIVDTHNSPVVDDVWALYHYIISKCGTINTMIEWDEDIPAFETVYAELQKAKALTRSSAPVPTLPDFSEPHYYPITNQRVAYAERLALMQDSILPGASIDSNSNPESWIRPKPDFPANAQLEVYALGYRIRLYHVLKPDYPVLTHYLGEQSMDKLLKDFVNTIPSTHYNIDRYAEHFPSFLHTHLSDKFAHALCQLETIIASLAFAPETPSISQADMQHLSPDAFLTTRFSMHPASALLSLGGAVNRYYQQVRDGLTPSPITEQPSYLLVYKHEGTIWRLELEKEEYTLLNTLQTYPTFTTALDALSKDETVNIAPITEQFATWFARWLQNGVFSRNGV